MSKIDWKCQQASGGRLVFIASQAGRVLREMAASPTDPIMFYSYFSPSHVESDRIIRDFLDEHEIEVSLWSNRSFTISAADFVKLKMVLL